MSTHGWRWSLLLSLLALVGPAEVRGQQILGPQPLPEELVQDVLDFLNDPSTLRFQGDARVPADAVLSGNVALVSGELVVAGEVRGSVVVVNADLVVEEGARILGDVVLVGGEATGPTDQVVQGSLVRYGATLSLARVDGVYRLRRAPGRDRPPGFYIGSSRLIVRSGAAYNRVEGLPVMLGPVIQTSDATPLRFEGFAVFRTDSGFSTDDMGYRIGLSQSLGDGVRWTLGASAYSEVVPFERRGLSDLETSLTSFLYHRDNRDYFRNEGWSASLGLQGARWPLSLTLTYRNEDHGSAVPGSPWTLFRNDQPWAPMPLVAEGDLGSLEARLEVDRRNNPDDPTDGWSLDTRLVRGVSGSLGFQEILSLPGSPTPPAVVDTDFTFGRIDLRRYARVGPDSDLSIRVLASGSLSGDPLPPQFQQALGGPGTLPGLNRFAVDCGARRTSRVLVPTDEDSRDSFLRYGCDRSVLFQAEYREELSFRLDLSSDDEDWDGRQWLPRVDLTAAWVVFLDAGRGWSFDPEGVDSDTVADAGVGFYVGDVGFYFALPLTGDDRDVNFTVRLQHRF